MDSEEEESENDDDVCLSWIPEAKVLVPRTGEYSAFVRSRLRAAKFVFSSPQEEKVSLDSYSAFLKASIGEKEWLAAAWRHVKPVNPPTLYLLLAWNSTPHHRC